MRLLEQIIRKKMDLSLEFLLNKNYKRGIWNFYSCYNLSLAVLGKQDDNFRKRNIVWRKFLLKEIDEKGFKKMQKFMQKDMLIIIQALKLITEETEKLGFDIGDIYKKSNIGILSYEYPE